MTLDEALHYIHAVCWKGSIPGLERISALLDKMGHPERTLKFVHVTGTNGKGSTCAMVASVLRQAGYRTGLYTSPYIVRFNERMQINGEQIPDDELCAITEEIKPLADSIFEQPTEFEMVTAIAFAWFARRQCDIVVCEVGMGGEFDATNVIGAPEAAVLCNIGLDHTEVLGDTLEKIAATKSGIIKPGCDAVLYRSTDGVEAVVEQRCREVGAALHKVDFTQLHLRQHSLEGQVFDFGGLAWFTMGGAASHDIQDGILDPADPDFEHRYWLMRRMRSMFRVKGVSWWAEEMPSQAEYQEALANLERVNWTVDCVLTHCAPSGVVQEINPSYGTDELTDFLEMVSQRCKFAYWFFGHYHENRIIDQKYILQWEKISELGF